MRTARFFVSSEWIALGAGAFSIPIGSIYKQIVTVLRMKVGDNLSLCPNNDTEIDGKIQEITKVAILGSIVEVKAGKPLYPRVTICAAITKRDTFEWMLQKCTELGVSIFMPILTERVVKRGKDVPVRWQEIVREASEQSGRTLLPTIIEPLSLSAALVKTANYDHKIMMHETADKKFDRSLVRQMDKVAIFVGPEGGFSDKEVAQAVESGSELLQVGDLVLRAETAATVGAALIRLL